MSLSSLRRFKHVKGLSPLPRGAQLWLRLGLCFMAQLLKDLYRFSLLVIKVLIVHVKSSYLRGTRVFSTLLLKIWPNLQKTSVSTLIDQYGGALKTYENTLSFWWLFMADPRLHL